MSKHNKITLIVLLLLGVISLAAYLVFYHLDVILIYYDASSRLNIARKIIDNLTPGLGQIGTLWLPLPQLLMLPFIWFEPFWHSGFAGSIVSMVSFVLAGYFLFKTIYEWTNDYIAAGLTLLLYVTNINVLYMQTTPMSEPFFIMTLFVSIYFFVKWVKYDQIFDLMGFGAFISLATLTRYEGYFSLLFSFLMVTGVLMVRKSPFKSIEGKLILFGTLAITGVLLWTVYQTVIFKDPIYWLKVYTQQASIISTEENRVDTIAETREGRKVSYLDATVTFFNTGAQVNGILISYFSVLCLLYILGVFIYRKEEQNILYSLSFLIPLGAFIFTVVAVAGGFPLDSPALSLSSLFDESNKYFIEFNIRYGLIVLPLILLSIGIFAANSRITKSLVVMCIILQLGVYFIPGLYFQYSIPQFFLSRSRENRVENSKPFLFLKENYDGGLILVSALKHDPEMFYLGIDYRNFIHEGTQHYWTESIETPQKYATWIYMYAPNITAGREEDSVTKELKDNPGLLEHYDLVYKDSQYYIYRLKDEN